MDLIVPFLPYNTTSVFDTFNSGNFDRIIIATGDYVQLFDDTPRSGLVMLGKNQVQYKIYYIIEAGCSKLFGSDIKVMNWDNEIKINYPILKDYSVIHESLGDVSIPIVENIVATDLKKDKKCGALKMIAGITFNDNIETIKRLTSAELYFKTPYRIEAKLRVSDGIDTYTFWITGIKVERYDYSIEGFCSHYYEQDVCYADKKERVKKVTKEEWDKAFKYK